jgi:hypothetical protein
MNGRATLPCARLQADALWLLLVEHNALHHSMPPLGHARLSPCTRQSHTALKPNNRPCGYF